MKALYKKYYLLVSLFLVVFGKNVSSQIHYYSDCYNGGVVGDGYTAWYFGDTSSVQLPIPEGCSIKKAFLFSNIYKYQSAFMPASDKMIEINGQPLVLSEINSLNNYHSLSIAIDLFVATIVQYVTDYIDLSNPMHHINPHLIENPLSPEQTPLFSDFYILVLYENPSLPQVCFEAYINTFDAYPNLLYQLNTGSSMDTNTDVGFAINSSHLCDNEDEGYEVGINDTYIGSIGGKEDNTTIDCAGVIGSFDYHDSTLTGIGNDSGNNTMNGLDAIANIQSYMSDSFELNITFDYASDWRPFSNLINQLFFTYSSPCEVFNASVSENLTICKGTQTQLQAIGGNAYAWQPQVDLSCYDCPNPVFIGDTSRFYTCRIWNTDSCSKVLPVKVNVLPNPAVLSYSVTPAQCYGNTGEIEINNPPAGFTYALNEGVPQSQTLFEGLQQGYHVLTVIDNNGCESDTSIYISEVNSTVAQFSVSPQSGDVPLEVTLTNQSQHATNYVWYIGNDTIQTTSSAPFTHTFNTEGNFDIALVAYHTTEECGDTTNKSVLSEFPFTVIVPTLYGGYADGSPYRIYTSGLSSLQFKLYSDDGRLIHVAELTPSAGYITLWESTDIASGLYVYHIRAIAEDGTEKMITGKLVVV